MHAQFYWQDDTCCKSIDMGVVFPFQEQVLQTVTVQWRYFGREQNTFVVRTYAARAGFAIINAAAAACFSFRNWIKELKKLDREFQLHKLNYFNQRFNRPSTALVFLSLRSLYPVRMWLCLWTVAQMRETLAHEATSTRSRDRCRDWAIPVIRFNFIKYNLTNQLWIKKILITAVSVTNPFGPLSP